VDIQYSLFLGHPPSVLEFTPGASFSVSLPGVLFPGKPHLSDNLEQPNLPFTLARSEVIRPARTSLFFVI